MQNPGSAKWCLREAGLGVGLTRHCAVGKGQSMPSGTVCLQVRAPVTAPYGVPPSSLCERVDASSCKTKAAAPQQKQTQTVRQESALRAPSVRRRVVLGDGLRQRPCFGLGRLWRKDGKRIPMLRATLWTKTYDRVGALLFSGSLASDVGPLRAGGPFAERVAHASRRPDPPIVGQDL